jgi:hypothetical protein
VIVMAEPEERDFAALVTALAELRDHALAGEPSDRALAKMAKVAPGTVGNWWRGTFPQDLDRLPIVVRGIADQARRRGL